MKFSVRETESDNNTHDVMIRSFFQAVHTLCNDLLSPGTYFRFNPYLSEPFTLDETRPEKMDRLRMDAQMYLRRNDRKFAHAADRLVQPRSLTQKCKDYLKDNIQERLV